jgi:hypothetical protein
VARTQLFRVTCPYCALGGATVDVTKHQGAHTADTKPRQCDYCHKYFDVQVKLILTGIPLDPLTGQTRNKAVARALRHIVTGS